MGKRRKRSQGGVQVPGSMLHHFGGGLVMVLVIALGGMVWNGTGRVGGGGKRGVGWGMIPTSLV